MDYQELFQSLGLSKNESKIYEILIRYGERGVGFISEKSGVHRRNVYDSLNRLLEKALVTEIIESSENKYQAAEPKKLLEIIREKSDSIEKLLPSLEKIYFSTPTEYKVHTYRGKEGWKQYMKDILRADKPFYSIAAQGAWMDTRVKSFYPGFLEQMKKKKIPMHHLFDYDVKESTHEILNHVGKNFKFLPKKYATNSGIDVFGDRVNIMHQQYLGKVGTDEEIIFTVIVNQNLADSFRTWFQYMWDMCPNK